jgi:hypothetical protein
VCDYYHKIVFFYYFISRHNLPLIGANIVGKTMLKDIRRNINMTGQFENQTLGFSYVTNNNFETNTKLSEDRYEIYVNDDFVGYKTLFNSNDKLNDVNDFLTSQGIKNFQTQLEGDHYYVRATETDKIKDALNVYCHNR